MQKCYYLRMEVRGEEVLITVTEKVRFVETDAMGVAHHSNYFRWFEMGRVEFLKQHEVEFLAEPLVEFDSSEQARYTLRQKDLSGSAWKNLLLAIFARFSEEIVPIIKLDGQYLFDPAHLKVAAD